MAQRTCTVEGCGGDHNARGLCAAHNYRLRKHGDVMADVPLKHYGAGTCDVDGCARKHHANRLCHAHYERLRVHGTLKLDRPISERDGHITSTGYRMIPVTDHPLANAGGQVYEHRMVLFDAIGPGTHPCRWCGTDVSWDLTYPASIKALVVDHIDNDKINNDPLNLAPSCHPCNAPRHQASEASVQIPYHT